MQKEKRARIYKLENGRYSVYLFYQIDDPFVADTHLYDIKVFKSRKQAEKLASYWEG